MKATAKANSNTALIKYWGKKDEELIIPMNNSISLTIDSLTTYTTVEFSQDFLEDSFILNNEKQIEKALERVVKHLNLLRSLAKVDLKAKVISKNNFPTAAGLASSASGFAALTLASCKALGLKVNSRELSILARQGSGSAARSVLGGYVEWLVIDEKNDSSVIQLADKDWFDIRDIIVIFEKHKRKISTRDAMKLSMETSPFYKARLETIEENLAKIRQAIKDKNFSLLGKTAESDCLSMHSVAFTSDPSLIFWTGETLAIMTLVKSLRDDGLEAYFTIDTGSNMHILTLPKYAEKITGILKELPYIRDVIVAKPGDGATIVNDHLF
ncbi:MAG: diphosphomevalonate decarboxylase [Candidatus Heimdallarchaeota archaeon]|nr:diphosphomevalonate decarboxylase [Candidatus Heimdallarchaeota archaeon]